MNQVYQFDAQVVDRESIFVSYCFPTGINPIENESQILMWPASEVLWGITPFKSFPITSNDSNGERILNDLQLQETSYTLALTASSDQQSIVALSRFLPGTVNGIPSTVQIKVQQTGADVLSISVITPTGNIPVKNSNWIGIWEGAITSYSKDTCLQYFYVNSRQSAFTETIGKLPLKYNTLYTVVYGVGSSRADIGATTTLITTVY